MLFTASFAGRAGDPDNTRINKNLKFKLTSIKQTLKRAVDDEKEEKEESNLKYILQIFTDFSA